MASGKVAQVRGPVVDVEFPTDQLPELLSAIRIVDETRGVDLIVEVAKNRGDNTVRCIAMDSTDGLMRGMPAEDTGGPIQVPVGRPTLGRIYDVIGRPVDDVGPVESDQTMPIHREPPGYAEQEIATQIFETRIKVHEQLSPSTEGG